ncbi:MAG: hypothetical protein ACRC9L_06435 [Brevinema sp.]
MTYMDMSKRWTKALALAAVVFTVSACAVSEGVEPYSQDQSEFSVESSAKSSARSSYMYPIEQTIYRSNVSGIDWRTQIGKTITDKDLYGYVIQDHQHRKFNFYTETNGNRHWMNYTFFWNRKDVWYNIVSEKEGILQSGWTTVSLSQQDIGGRNVMYIDWDVTFEPYTRMPQKLAVFLSGSEHRGVVTNRKLTSNPGRGHFGIRDGHQHGSAFSNTNIDHTITRDTNSGRHWEKQLVNSGFTNTKLTNAVFSYNNPRQFHYYNTPDGDKYWLTLTFFRGSPLVAYGFISDKKGGLQHGWTTLDVVRAVRSNQEVVRLDIDVSPHPSLNMQKHIYIWLNSKDQLRGSITNSSLVIPNFDKGNFGVDYYGKLFQPF